MYQQFCLHPKTPVPQRQRLVLGELPSAKSELLAALKACGRSRDLATGKVLHRRATESGLVNDNYVGNSLITMYSKCHSMANARAVFDGMDNRSVVSWSALLHGYADNGESLLVLELFDTMHGLASAGSAPSPNDRTYVAAISACATLGDQRRSERSKWLDKGMVIHSLAEQSNACDMFVESALVDMYSKCRSMVHARRVFERMAAADVVTWSCLIQGYVDNGDCEQALEIFDRMISQGACAPSSRTYVAALVACATLGRLEKGKRIHSEAVERRLCDIFVETTLVDMYLKCGCVEEARRVFDNMKRRNIVSWNCLIQGYVVNGDSHRALAMFDYLEGNHLGAGECIPDARTYVAALEACSSSASKGPAERGKWLDKGKEIHSLVLRRSECSNVFVENALVEMYEKCCSMVGACFVFDSMSERDIVSWNCLVRGYVNNGEHEQALEMISGMDRLPNAATFVAALMASGNMMSAECGRFFHGGVNKLGLEHDLVLTTCMLECYAKCGNMVAAKLVFDSMSHKDTMAWNALILGYSQRCEPAHVFAIFKVMVEQGVAPDKVTFLHMLSACSHSGMSERAMEVFDAMVSDHGVEPELEHYACMVDLLGRANQVEEAVKFIRMMPFEPDHVVWHSLLSSCRKWKNVELGKLAYDSLVRLNDRDAGNYVCMAQIYQKTK